MRRFLPVIATESRRLLPPRFGSVLCLSALTATAAYRPLDTPATWVIPHPTPALAPADGSALGEFQPGIRVDVLEERGQDGQWLVTFQRLGEDDIIALIPIPNLAEMNPQAFARVRGTIDAFPLLRTLLETPVPWLESAPTLAQEVFPHGWSAMDKDQRILIARDAHNDAKAWGARPLAATVDASQSAPRIILEFWNKGDAHRSRLQPAEAKDRIRSHLIELENAFSTWRGDSERRGTSQAITALRRDSENFFLPNDIQAILRYRPDEYLLLELTSFRGNRQSVSSPYDPQTFAAKLRARVKTHADGYRYITGIPMIYQGDKGYCAAATLARVLNFYGYPVDMHAIAELAETEGQTGTRLANVLTSMQRICNSTPFRMREVRQTRRAELLQFIDRGVPLIWLIPGHMRLLIGVHPEGGIVYTDSWGPGHEFKTMPWNEFLNLNRGLYRIEPE